MFPSSKCQPKVPLRFRLQARALLAEISMAGMRAASLMLVLKKLILLSSNVWRRDIEHVDRGYSITILPFLTQSKFPTLNLISPICLKSMRGYLSGSHDVLCHVNDAWTMIFFRFIPGGLRGFQQWYFSYLPGIPLQQFEIKKTGIRHFPKQIPNFPYQLFSKHGELRQLKRITRLGCCPCCPCFPLLPLFSFPSHPFLGFF